MKRVPGEGIVGRTALREARAGDFGQVTRLVSLAWGQAYPNSAGYLAAIFPDRIVMECRGRFYSYPYAIDDANQVTFQAPTEVVADWAPAAASTSMVEACFIEAAATADGQPAKYLVRVIRAGLSGNGVIYPAAVLREATPLFAGARVFSKSDAEHIKGDGKDFRQLVGRLVDPRFVEATGKVPAEIQATLEVLETSDVATKLREAVSRGMNDLFGLSIDASGRSRKSGEYREATSIVKVASVDLIVEPGAGGQVIRFAEAQATQEPDMLRQQMLNRIKSSNPALAASLANASDEDVLTRYNECLQAEAAPAVGDVEARIRMIEARAHARAAVGAAKLPAAAKARLNERFAQLERFTEAEADTMVQAEVEYLGRLAEAGKIVGLGDPRVEAGDDRADKVGQQLDAFFDRSKPATSFREAYVEITGDTKVTGLIGNCDMQRLREAAGANFREAISASTFSNILGTSITRALLNEYRNLDAYTDWRWAVDIVPVNDFRTQERTRLGGYGNLATVAENGPYAAMTSPGDEKATYALTKKGGKETISLETIANDDVGILRRIPLAMARAAGRTLYEFVYDFMRTNAAIYDTVALFHATHNNLGTAALDATSFAAARLAMKQQTELTSTKRLGILARHLVVPSDLEEAAFNLFVRGTNQDETFVQSRKPMVHVADYFTDTNNWYVTADKGDVPLIQLGFYGGNEEPEIFVQDLPTQGSLFSNDQIVYKIRHIYSGAVMDYRGFYGAVVA